jgi:hypothetical protein
MIGDEAENGGEAIAVDGRVAGVQPSTCQLRSPASSPAATQRRETVTTIIVMISRHRTEPGNIGLEADTSLIHVYLIKVGEVSDLALEGNRRSLQR